MSTTTKVCVDDSTISPQSAESASEAAATEVVKWHVTCENPEAIKLSAEIERFIAYYEDKYSPATGMKCVGTHLASDAYFMFRSLVERIVGGVYRLTIDSPGLGSCERQYACLAALFLTYIAVKNNRITAAGNISISSF